MRKPVLLALALGFAALFFGWETWQARQGAPVARGFAAPATPGSWQPGIVSPDPPPPADLSTAVSAVAGRPLFRQDRQPFRESLAGTPARNYDAELSRFSMLGVLAFGDELKGIVVSRSGARTERWELRAGESFPGFTVKEVRTDSLLVTADGREFQLPLYAGPPTSAGGALRTDVSKAAAAPATASVPPPPGKPAPRAGPAVAPPMPLARPQPSAPASPRDLRPRYVPGRR